MALSLAEFTVEQAVFEVRFSEAYRLWDRAGDLACRADHFRGKLVSAEPGQVAFRKDRLEVVFALKQAHVILHHPTTLDHFPEHASEMESLVRSVLEVPIYTRVGMRTVAFRKTDTLDAAASKLLSTKLLRLPAARSFDAETDAAVGLAEYAVRLQGRARATTVRLRADERRLDFDPPPSFKQLDLKSEETFGLVLDVDQFTLAPMEASQLVVREWVRGAIHLYRRDAGNFLSGAPA